MLLYFKAPCYSHAYPKNPLQKERLFNIWRKHRARLVSQIYLAVSLYKSQQQQDQQATLQLATAESSLIVILLHSLISSASRFASLTTAASCSRNNIGDPTAQAFALFTLHGALDLTVAWWIDVQARDSTIGAQLAGT
jgi:hypothetical protein